MKILAKRAAGGGPSAPGSKEIPVGAPNCLVGLTFVFTGELSSITRDDAQDLVKRYGGRVTGSVSGKTSYVVVGEDAGASKLTKAASLKVKTLDEDALFDLIASSSSKDAGAAAPASSASVKKSAASAGKKTAVSETVAAATKADSGIPSRYRTELWTTKYKPRRYEDVMGNKANVQRLATWLRGWDASKASDKPSSAKDDPGHSRAILISGPPGIGKTTAAHLVATLEGFEIVEFNASDTRSKKTVASHYDGVFLARIRQGSLIFLMLATKQVLIMDEVDGMSAGDRGGIAELINIIKTTKIPIICICNDRQSPKVKSLVNHCFDMRFQRPRATEIEKAVKAIAAKEGLNIGLNVMGALVDSTHADIRQILNMLSTYALQENQLNYDQSKALGKSSEKNMSKSPWDVTGQLLGRGSFRDTSFADKLELYFNDFSLIPLMIQENYIKMDPALAGENSRPPKEKEMETLDCLSKAADSIAFGDIISSVQMKTQNWGLLPFHGVTSTLRPAFFTHGSLVSQGHWGGGYAFPSWLGKNSNQGKNMRLLKEIQLHMRLHVSADKNEVRQTYLPALAPLLTLPMAQDVSPSGVEQVIQTMDEYYLTREDWDSILEIGLEECGLKALTADIPTATKSSFTRTYNKTNHPKPYMTASLLSKSRGGVGGGMSGVPDLEEAVENDEPTAGDEEESEEQDEDDVGGDRLIKKKVKSAAAMKKAGSANGSSKGAGRGKRAGDSVAKGVAKKQKK
ncbi:replication factor RFC1 C terminal domain-containing protein [Chytriomyces sp. MP71]|nr:replication factor RFC1 C terminal domain-containing protein [Chytriomyces sp. MP71]